MSKTRQLYQQIVQGRQPSESDQERIIGDGQAVTAFRQGRVARLMADWIAQQRKGLNEYMTVEIGSLNGLNLIKWLNAFLKYTYLVQEDRAYRKLEAYLESLERNGEKYAEIKRKRAERAAKSAETT